MGCGLGWVSLFPADSKNPKNFIFPLCFISIIKLAFAAELLNQEKTNFNL
jgi:hypothetical protein